MAGRALKFWVEYWSVRIGTWNLDGGWQKEHAAVIAAMDCDVLLLTEVPDRVTIPGMCVHASDLEMVDGVRWSAIASRSNFHALPDPHGASAMAQVAGLSLCSSVLPWNGCRPWWPFPGETESEWTANAVSEISAAGPQIWGGDWNHTLAGNLSYGSGEGQRSILKAVEDLGLRLATSELLARGDDLFSIDHIALPASWSTGEPERLQVDGIVSDHDAYIVETTPTN